MSTLYQTRQLNINKADEKINTDLDYPASYYTYLEFQI